MIMQGERIMRIKQIFLENNVLMLLFTIECSICNTAGAEFVTITYWFLYKLEIVDFNLIYLIESDEEYDLLLLFAISRLKN